MICGKEAGDNPNMIEVEMNVDADGELHSHAEHNLKAPGSVPHGATERKSGWAHFNCYAVWYERVYGSPFTMSA